jgi:hypothetical protein
VIVEVRRERERGEDYYSAKKGEKGYQSLS